MMKNVHVKLIAVVLWSCSFYGCTLSPRHTGPLKDITSLAETFYHTAIDIDNRGGAAAVKQDIKAIQYLAREKYKLIDITEAKLNKIVEAERNKTIPFEQKNILSIVVKKILFSDATIQNNEIIVGLWIQVQENELLTKPLQCKAINGNSEELSKADLFTSFHHSGKDKLGVTRIYRCRFQADKIANMEKVIIE